MNIIFGPVMSRRFGTSLGVDLSPMQKQCNFDCLYCELAPAFTVEKQQQSLRVSEIITALSTALQEHKNIDVITITANGEPTLYPNLDELVDAINMMKGTIQTLILTNSATIVNENTYNILLKFDQVKLSLDALSHDVFTKIDRPHHTIDITKIRESVIRFSHEYSGKLFIEILFVQGLNDTDEEINLLNSALLQMQCERIDVGTIDRPPAYPVAGISYEKLHQISQKFDASLPIHIASRHSSTSSPSNYSDEAILNTLDKRPLTYDDVELLFDVDTKKRLQKLITAHKVSEIKRSNLLFLVPTKNIARKRKKS